MRRTPNDQTRNLAQAAYDSLTTIAPARRRYLTRTLKKRVLLFLPLLFFYSAIVAQTTTTFPSSNSCTSKDLELVGAAITGGDACNSCEPNTKVTRTLTLSINNTTKSTRTSFAFWGTLVRTSAAGVVTRSPISGCNGPIERGIVNHIDYGEVTYDCGDAIKITDLFLAWTDASDKSACATINSATINPKCGTLPEITVNAGVGGSFTSTNVTCFGSAGGAINLSPFGGAGPYTYSWSGSNGGVVPATQAAAEDLTGLVAGTYTVRITDTKRCYADKIITISGPAAGLTLGTCSKTDVSCFGGSNGSLTAGDVTNALGIIRYSWKNAAGTIVGTTPVVNNRSVGTYTLTVSDDCTSRTCTVTIGGPAAGLSLGTCTKTNVSCSGGDGTVSAGAVGNARGTVNYVWKNAANAIVGNTATVNNLGAGTYTLTVSDDCSSQTCSVTVGAPPAITTPAASVTQQPTCNTGSGIVSVTNPDANTTYTLVSGGTIRYTSTDGIFNGVVPGSYSIVGSTGICSATGNSVTVNQQPSTPGVPHIVISKFPDCSSAEGTLLVKLNATTDYSSDYEFSSDGTNFVNSNEFSFTAGQGYTIYVRTKGTDCVSSSICQGQNGLRTSSTTANRGSQPVAKVADVIETEQELKVLAYPNPFNEKINFVISSPVAGQGSLEIYNALGQKIKNVYSGHITRGKQNFELKLPLRQTANLIYVLRVGDQRISGKILQLNR